VHAFDVLGDPARAPPAWGRAYAAAGGSPDQVAATITFHTHQEEQS
jgi:hypothetical protein